MSHDEADTAAGAREGLLDSVAGKAKEVAGAVTGNDDLTEEGQLQQAEAKHRKAAVADEALADAKRREAADELRETTHEAAAEKEAAHDKADLAQRAVDSQRSEEHAEAERAATQQEAVERQAAQQRADDLAESRLDDAEALAADADSTERQAAADQARLEREATAAEEQAARLRAQTDSKG
ncbi:MAG: hypothetical protein JWR27_2914 [Aeromicrobium sp.]|jgi:uncharacterized protein YjbJ (UPF0337 family)|nr:hypothetical protein [Aeromicrobium sp.]